MDGLWMCASVQKKEPTPFLFFFAFARFEAGLPAQKYRLTREKYIIFGKYCIQAFRKDDQERLRIKKTHFYSV